MGERTLLNAERRMVISAGWGLADTISAEAPQGNMQFGIVLFDRLTWQQQFLMVEKVLTALLEPTIPTPPSTALMDATVAAIYAQLYTSVEIELDDARMDRNESLDEENYFEVRQGILEALREPVDSDEPMEESPDGGWPDLLCDELEEWELAIESLRNRILADEDWQMETLAMDLAPDTSKSLKKEMGIQRDYFIDIPPDVSDEEAEAARWRIVKLGRRILNEPEF